MRPRRWLQVILAMMLAAVGCQDTETGTPVAQEEMTPVAKLHAAAKAGNIEQVRALIASGCEVDARDDDGCTALHTSAWYGESEVAAYLISQGADISATDPHGVTPLHLAASRCHADVARLLVTAGADVSACTESGGTPLSWAGSGSCALYFSADTKDVAELLLAEGAHIDPNDKRSNEILLLVGARHGLRNLARMLLEAGTDANVTDWVGGYGTSALRHAMFAGDPQLVELLIAYGADVNRKDRWGRTPLHYAHTTTREVIEVLVAHGADVNAGARQGFFTPLHAAAQAFSREAVQALLAHGADVNATYSGETALDEAIALGAEDIAVLLQNATREKTADR